MGKIVLVSGGARGIGRATAEIFIEQGFKVIILDRDGEELNKTCKQIIGAVPFNYDVSDENSMKEISSRVDSEFGRLDCLINNAGITGSTTELWNYDYEEWKKIININLHGTFNCCKSVVPEMIKNNYGRIVNIASVSGKDGNAKASAYSSSKAGVIALTKSLGKELADKNIAVNAVTPAGAKTRILDQMSKEHVQRMLSKVPRARFLELEELTSMVCWLSSAENSFSTAAVFDISGGRSTY